MKSPAPEIDLKSSLNRIRELCIQFGIRTLDQQIFVCERLISEDQRQNHWVDIAVFGRFKAGKSSFLNSLVGESILPVGVVPVTAVITQIFFGEVARVQVKYLTGKTQEIPLSEIKQFVTEEENPENCKAVERIDVEHPGLRSFPGLRFVDTPGLGSVFKHNTETSLQWLQEVGVAIVAVSVDPPLSEQDLSLIQQLKKYTPKIVLLLTKADLLDHAQLEQVLGFVSHQTQKAFGTSLACYPFSILTPYENWRKNLKDGILAPLAMSRDQNSRTILEHKWRTLILELRGYLQLAGKAAAHAQAERKALFDRIISEQNHFSQSQRVLKSILRGMLDETRPQVVRRLKEVESPFLERLKNELEIQLRQSKGNLWQVTRQYEAWHRLRFQEELERISNSQKTAFLQRIEDAEGTLTRQVEKLSGDLAESVERVLGVRLEKAQIRFKTRKIDIPSSFAGRVFDTPIDLLWFLIPMSIFRSRVHKHLLDQLPFEVEKSLSRLASVWIEYINQGISLIEKEAEEVVSNELKTIESLVGESKPNQEEVRAALLELERWMS